MPSPEFFAAIAAQDSDDAAIVLITIDHASMPAPIRLCDAPAGIVSNGETFEAWPLQAPLPGDSGEAGRRAATIVADNIDPSLLARLSVAPTRHSVRIDIVLASAPDDLQFTWSRLELRSYQPVGGALAMEIAPRDDSEERFPHQGFTPARTPGIFA